VPAAQKEKPAAGEPDWEKLYEAIIGKGKEQQAAPPKPQTASKPQAPTAADSSIRVDTARYDQILNLTGEIGLVKNRIACLRSSLAQGGGDAMKALDQAVNTMSALVGELQSSVMKARMQPVVRVFQKYNRLARDLARQLGKECELEIDAEGTEVDKTILDALNDPLVHLVRNAVDHGIEMPGEREAAGKPRRATVRLAARQAGDHIVIEVGDDGKGMRADVIRQKAIEKGLLGAAEASALDERASLALIFLPGFSTKEAVSDLSGRGVGMDVVRTNIEKLKGRIDIHSEPGRGTRFVVSLPLTLAILPVLMMGVCGQRYAIPLAQVREVLAVDAERLQRVADREVMLVRGEPLPFVDLAGPLARERNEPCRVAVIAQCHGQELALGADACFGRDEVMLKALAGFKPRGVAGATLAGDGSLIIVLELGELLN
jgi:two-component system chemotaxis sensor kinase CheA